MDQWEYRIESFILGFGSSQGEPLNELGREGWEAYGVFAHEDRLLTYVYVYLKRLVEEP